MLGCGCLVSTARFPCVIQGECLRANSQPTSQHTPPVYHGKTTQSKSFQAETKMRLGGEHPLENCCLQVSYAPLRENSSTTRNSSHDKFCSSVPCPGVANSETLRRQTREDTPANKVAGNVPTTGRSLPVMRQPYREIPAGQKVAIFQTFSDMFLLSPYEDFFLNPRCSMYRLIVLVGSPCFEKTSFKTWLKFGTA